MAGNPKLKVEFELTAKQKKILGYVLLREKVPPAEVCRRLLVNYLNILRDAAMTGVLPRVPQEPKPPPPPRPGRVRPEILHGAEQYSLVSPWLGRSRRAARAGAGAPPRSRRVKRSPRRKKAVSARRRRARR